MKLNDLDDIDKSYLRITDFENYFNIYQDKQNNYYYNLNSTMYINVAEDALLSYTCNHELQWPIISFKIYGTTRLAWLLMKINKVQAKDVFKVKKPGDVIKYIDKKQMNSLVSDMNGFNQ